MLTLPHCSPPCHPCSPLCHSPLRSPAVPGLPVWPSCPPLLCSCWELLCCTAYSHAGSWSLKWPVYTKVVLSLPMSCYPRLLKVPSPITPCLSYKVPVQNAKVFFCLVCTACFFTSSDCLPPVLTPWLSIILRELCLRWPLLVWPYYLSFPLVLFFDFIICCYLLVNQDYFEGRSLYRD